MHRDPNAAGVLAAARSSGRIVGKVAVAILVGLTSACAARVTGAGASATPQQVTRDAQLLAMIDQRERDTTLVDSLLLDSSAERRARAALAIGQVQMRARYPRLRALLLDADTGVAANAAFALGLAKDSAALVALGRAVAGAADPVAREAAWALGELGDVARPLLSIALGEGAPQPLANSTAALRSGSVRAELLLATAKMRSVQAAVITPWLADTSAEAVRAAAYAISRARFVGGYRALMAVASSPDELVRQHVARALARTGLADSLADQARSLLRVLVADSSARVRANAVRSLATFGSSVRADVLRTFADPDGNVRVAATENLGTAFLRDSDSWMKAWSMDSSFVVRRALLLGARRAGSDALQARENEWIADVDWRRRGAALEASLQRQGPDRMPLAQRFLGDADGRVRAVALSAIDSGTLATAEGRARVRQLLADSDLVVRAQAVGVLGRRASAAELPEIVALYERHQTAATDDVRRAALRYIASAWTRDSARIDATLRARLAKVPVPDRVAERAIVGRVGPLLGWRDLPAVDAPRAAADYERIARRAYANGSRPQIAVLHTERGDISIELFSADAPLVVEAFVRLAESGYYRDTWFHRVVPNFVAQDGNPRGDGSGGPGFSVRDAWTRQRHERGSVGLATAGPDTGGAQYYFCHSPQPHLDGHYTVFGRLVSGLDVLDRIVQGDRVRSVEIR